MKEVPGSYWAEVISKAGGIMGGDGAKVIQHLKGDAPDGSVNVISKQGLTSLRIHSDNAKQHFKSSKSIYFFTKQLVGGSGGSGFTSITWDFGAPGHG